MRINQTTAAIGLAGFIAALASFGGATAHAAAAPVASQPADIKAVVQDTVAPGDTLSGIANDHQTTYVRLYDANGQIEHPDVIHPGEVVRIPAAEEQLANRPMPEGAAVKQAVASTAQASTGAVQARPAASLPGSSGVAASGSTWDKLAMCESGGNWAINTGNGFYGGLQFTLSSWQGVGGTGYPHQASREQQIAMAEKLLARQGWGAWPACTSKLGMR